MGVTWTKEQQKVIDLRNRNILVSAAAGSGKTAVLVERILTMITEGDHPLDIDQLLIVTFTRAAAAEMKERIRSAVEERLEKEPDNEHLQRQSTLIHNAQINTIDGFCSYVIRNYFHMIDLDPGFRTAEDGELRLMKQDVMKKVIEDAYEAGTEEFYACVECYASGKDDDNIGQQVMKLYEYSMSYPWPKEWLSDCKKYYELKSVDDLMKTKWMRFLMEESKKIFQDAKDMALELLQLCRGDDGPYMYEAALESDLGMIEKLLATEDYDTLVDVLASIKYARLSSKKDENVSERVRMQVQAGRAEVKDMLNHLRDSYFYMSLEEILESIQACKKPVCALIDLTLTFTEAFAARKREKNLVDFADMEHFALDVLVKKQDDKLVYTQAAKEFSERFAEIFIDEYQDSNLVQETILTAVSKIPEGGHNIFMVGDVKQSIYRFRLARPELFMEKFHSYSTEDSLTQRIDLHKNFRSRAQVLSGVNYIFRQIMGKELGDVEYDDEAALYPGAQFPKESQENEHETELLLIESDGEGLEEERGAQTDKEVEALAVAGRIAELIEHEMVYDKKEKGYRKARYSDIVILLRTMTGWTETFGQVLASQGIPSYSASKTGYFSALEVVTVLNYLHILDNPRQDIPLGSILHSPIGGCSSEEMAKIRICNKDGSLYESLQIYLQQGSDNELRRKLQKFWEQYQKLRDCVPYTPIHELILLLLKETGYQLFVSAMPAGEQREANLRMLVEKAMEFEQTSYRGLFNFIRYIEQLQKYSVDYGEVNLLGGNDNVVQIMSIHKSKGLEFPIVIVAGLGKRFNQQDINASLVIHQDLGIGADCIDSQLRVKFPTVMKQVIRQKSKVENLGEELRVLYVAMTRAKEKLILSGCISKLETAVSDCQRLSGRKKEKFSYELLERARNYLDWILPAMARHPAFHSLYEEYGMIGQVTSPICEEGPITIRLIRPRQLLEEQVEKQVMAQISKEEFLHWDSSKVYDGQLRNQLQARFSYRYPYENLAQIPVKVTVSELKHQASLETEDSYLLYEDEEIVPVVPAFMQETEETGSGPVRGTAYHRIMECLDFSKTASAEEIQEQISQLKETGKIDGQTAHYINPMQIFRMAQSTLGKRMAAAQKAGTIRREQPFVISQKASEIKKEWGEEESILVQGIIDAYFVENGKIILVDYKTDRVRSAKELVNRYHVQLVYYAQALERLTGMPVEEKIIYSFALGKEITV